MANNQKQIELVWHTFLTEAGLHQETKYEAWAFGDSSEMANDLLALVLEGKKTATAGAYVAYEHNQEPLPEVGSYSVCLDGNGEAQCVIQTTAVKTVPFKEMTAADAFKEGEGDQSLGYWRRVHQAFWERELVSYPVTFSEELLVVFEEFKVVYKGSL